MGPGIASRSPIFTSCEAWRRRRTAQPFANVVLPNPTNDEETNAEAEDDHPDVVRPVRMEARELALPEASSAPAPHRPLVPIVETAGKVLLAAGLALAILGIAALALSKVGVDRLPATLTWRSGDVTVFVPVGLMIVASIVGTIVLNIFLRR